MAALLVSTSTAFAWCSTPSFYESEPSPPSSFSKPSVPYCLNAYSYTQKHSCSEWELNSYFDEVDEYIEELEDYYGDVVEFANAAAALADEALRYARCEAEEVSSQHE